jgi:hypothetical protein
LVILLTTAKGCLKTSIISGFLLVFYLTTSTQHSPPFRRSQASQFGVFLIIAKASGLTTLVLLLIFYTMVVWISEGKSSKFSATSLRIASFHINKG